MNIPKHYKVNEFEKYENLYSEAKLLVELLETTPNPNIKLLEFNNFIYSYGISFPNEQMEDDFMKTVQCNYKMATETMLKMYVEALEKEKAASPIKRYNKSHLEEKFSNEN